MTDSPPIAQTPARAEVTLPDRIRAFLTDDLHFASISTIDPDGKPRPAVVWYLVEGDELVLNSAVGRRWPANLLSDPRMSISVLDGVDGYRWVGFVGEVRAVTDQAIAQSHIARMARRYHADDPEVAERLIRDRYEHQERISFRFRPWAVHDHLDDD
jgi:PPOX class probable F420-dependent enzyme